MSHDQQALQRLENRIWDLIPWRNRAEWAVTDWTVHGPEGGSHPLGLGERWDGLGWPARLEADLPEPTSGEAVLELAVGGEGLVYLDGAPVGGLNPFHREFPAMGVRHVAVEAVPKGLFGVPNPEPWLHVARLVVPDAQARALYRELATALAAVRELGDHPAQPLLIQAIEEALALVRLPSGAAAVQARLWALRRELALSWEAAQALADSYRDTHSLVAITRLTRALPRDAWQGDPGDGIGVDALPPLEGVAEARAHLQRRLRETAERYPPVGQLAACGHAHIDLAWLWPLGETRRKARRTFATALALMERHREFRFTQSMAQLYAVVREDDPALFEQVRQRVQEGRWEPIGGMWVEPDCNLSSGEALVRHLLYGQRFFEQAFGRRSTVAWLPDTFGFTAALPQILAGAGIRSFFTHKLTWNETNCFPHDLWLWEGLDGTRVLAHSFENPVGGYNGQVTPRATLATWRNFRGKRVHPESLFTYGYGDGGGGPNDEMLAQFDLLQAYPVLPRLRHTTVEAFFERIQPDDLPVWVGELYLELHRGTYTSQGRIKRLNRAAEHRLVEAEAAATLASLAGADYPQERLTDAWTTLLRNQFHDILPGSSIREVNEEAEAELASAVAAAEGIRDTALAHLAARLPLEHERAIGRLVAVNLHGAHRPLSFRASLPDGVPTFRLLAPDGRDVPWQRLSATDMLVHDPGCIVPGVGYLSLGIVPGDPAPPASIVTATTDRLENESLRITLGPDGMLASVYDKREQREVLAGPGNQLWAYLDRPRAWDAWDIDANYEEQGEPVTTVEAVQVVAAGPLEAAIEVVRGYRSSRITQRYVLRAGSARLDIQTEIAWHERQVLLRALFPLAVRSGAATYETAYGAVDRPTHRNTSWDAARFEVPAHRWADLSEAGYGVSLLNDGKYGHSAHGNVLGLSLLRSPIFPDPEADAGTHVFSYALLPHRGDWRAGETLREALDLNGPLVAVATSPSQPDAAAETLSAPQGWAGQWIRVEGLSLGALKRAEDGGDLILRLYDPYGGRGVAEVVPAFPVVRATIVNLLEEDVEQLPVVPGEPIQVPYRPYQIVTLCLTPAMP